MRAVSISAVLLMLGCAASPQFKAVPPDIDRETAPKQIIEISAQDFRFTPEEIRVKKGALVTLKITSIDGTHGFKLGAFGIDERLDEHETKVIEFYAGEKGEYGFRCSHFCGLGHLGMTGKLVVE